MHFCPECGHELPQAGAHFCPDCGTRIPEGSGPVSPQGGDSLVSPLIHEAVAEAPVRYPRWTWIASGVGVALLLVVGLLVWNAVATAQRQTQVAAQSALMASVPDLRGLTGAQAADRVRAAGLEVGQTNYDPKAMGAVGAVVKQDPASGSRVRKGSLVVITVVGAQPVTVPNFVGLPSGGAQAAAAAVNLNVLAVPTSSKAKAGTVLSQEPTAGTSVQPGSSVSIMVAQGGSGSSSDGTHTPKKGSAERTAIMDACRIYLDYSGLFTVNELKVRGSRAFANVIPYDNPGWGSIGMYLLKNGNGWVVSQDSRTASYRGSFVSENSWLFNK